MDDSMTNELQVDRKAVPVIDKAGEIDDLSALKEVVVVKAKKPQQYGMSNYRKLTELFLADHQGELQGMQRELAEAVINMLGGRWSIAERYTETIRLYDIDGKKPFNGNSSLILQSYAKHQMSALHFIRMKATQKQYDSLVFYIYDKCNRSIGLDKIAQGLYSPLMSMDAECAAAVALVLNIATDHITHCYDAFLERESKSDQLVAFLQHISDTQINDEPMSRTLAANLITQIGGEIGLNQVRAIGENSNDPYKLHCFLSKKDALRVYMTHKEGILIFLQELSEIEGFNGIIDIVSVKVLNTTLSNDEVAKGLYEDCSEDSPFFDNKLIVGGAVVNFCAAYLCRSYDDFIDLIKNKAINLDPFVEYDTK